MQPLPVTSPEKCRVKENTNRTKGRKDTMTNINIEKLIESCDKLQQRTIFARGYMHNSARCFDACMRAFDNKALPANAITFKIFFNVPVMKPGEATIYRDGRMEMRTT